MLPAAEMTTMVHAWCDTASMAEACEARKRLVAELSEPVTQRVLWPGEGSKNIRAKPICEIFWPAQAQATTNVLCAIMQASSSQSEHHLSDISKAPPAACS